MRDLRRRIGHKLARSVWASVLGFVVVFGVPLLGHHSFATFYLEQDTMEVEGPIIEFQYRNPHSWVFVQGRDPFGKDVTYAAEWGGTSQLERNGITKQTLQAGDNVRIWASPNRNPTDNRIRLKRIERPADGWKWGQTRGQTR